MLSRGDFREYDGGCGMGGIPAYAGMTGGGVGMTGMGAGYDGRGGRECGNAKAQGRNEKQAGMTGGVLDTSSDGRL